MWARAIEAALGIWLMAAPAVLGHDDVARNHDSIVGPIVATLAIIAMTEVMRPLRWCSVAIGAWLVVAPWLLVDDPTARLNDALVGLLLLGLGLVRGRVEARFGGGWSALWNADVAARGEGEARR